MKDSFPQFTRYTVESRLSQGGMAAIYIAKHIELDRRVALKVPFITSSPEQLERFVREGKMLAKLDHPNIVQVYDAGSEHGITFLAMALIEGQSLENYLLVDIPPVEKTVEWAISLSGALDHIHQHNIFHRDIKAANIIIDATGKPVLVDFGISLDSHETRLTMSDRPFIGTLRYASPESLNGDPQLGRSDIYSFGVVLYQCLSGVFPYNSTDVKSFVVEVMRGAITPLEERRPDLPRWLTEIVMTCLKIDPEHRFASASHLQEALRAGLLSSTSINEQRYAHLETVDQAKHVVVMEPPSPDVAKTERHMVEEQNMQVEKESKAVEIHEQPEGKTGRVKYTLIGTGLGAVLIILLVQFIPFDSTSEPGEYVPAIIQGLVDVEPGELNQILRELRMQGRVSVENEAESVESPEEWYLILIREGEILALLTPLNSEGVRTDLLTDTEVSEDLEATFGPLYEEVYVFLYEEDVTG